MLLLPRWARSLDEATDFVLLRHWELAEQKVVKPEQKPRFIRFQERPWKFFQIEHNQDSYNWDMLDNMPHQIFRSLEKHLT